MLKLFEFELAGFILSSKTSKQSKKSKQQQSNENKKRKSKSSKREDSDDENDNNNNNNNNATKEFELPQDEKKMVGDFFFFAPLSHLSMKKKNLFR